jgi:predicted GIY-YIG superfamily endonuclease
MTAERPKTPVQLYRHYNTKGELLYVGIAKNPLKRLSEHRRSAHWASSSVRMTADVYPDRASALIAEATAIMKEKPLHNLLHLERAVIVNKCPKALVKPRKDEPTIMISVRLPISIVEKLNASCTKKDISRSQLIENALRKI